MMTIKVKYEALSNEVKNQTQFFTGKDLTDCICKMDEFNEWLAKGADIKKIFKTRIVETQHH